MSEQAKQTPLVELLTAVPEDVRIGVQDGEDWHAGTTWHSVGRLCRDAAAELRRLHAVNQELLEALVSFTKSGYIKKQHPKRYAAAVAAIARAEGEPK
jgi:hypothetical protein